MFQGDFRLFVGLGNPGSKYQETRHNIGFKALEKYAQTKAVSFHKNKKVYGELAQIGSGSSALKLLMPNTFMNESGKSIKAAMEWFDIEVDQLLVLVDDMDLPIGRLRLRSEGSSGGHNGLKSTIQHLGTQDFCRLRIGIGAPTSIKHERKTMTIPHVLGKFNSLEVPIMNKVLDEVNKGLDIIQLQGLTHASNHLNSYKSQFISRII